jgi:hypothetical protein
MHLETIMRSDPDLMAVLEYLRCAALAVIDRSGT